MMEAKAEPVETNSMEAEAVKAKVDGSGSGEKKIAEAVDFEISGCG